ncbi:MAG: class I SAM-dependent methyltransferase [Patescibacteria group bacterium]
MIKETGKQFVRDISPKLKSVALRVNSGGIKNALPIDDTLRLNPSILSVPKKPWARAVDDIETPFVGEYDEAEYVKNDALNLMGLYEMRTMLSAFGLPSLMQTDYQNKPLAGKQFLVAGTGTGREVVNLAALGGDVIGLDATYGYVDLTAKKLKGVASVIDPKTRIELFQCPAEDFPYMQDSLDGITSLFGVINHIQDWRGQIRKYVSAIKPDGRLVIEKYGSSNALVFELKKKGVLGYDPSILQSRDPEGKGILLGPNEPVLPASFPTDREFLRELAKNNLDIKRRIGFLRIAALFPKDPNPENLLRFMETVREVDEAAYDFIGRFKTPEELLFASFLYDIRSQKRTVNPVPIEDFAYVLYVGRKYRQEEFLKNFSH